MNKPAKKVENGGVALIKADPGSPVLKVTARDSIAIKAGTSFDGDHFPEDLAVMMPDGALEVGADYGVVMGSGGVPHAIKLLFASTADTCFAGFHFAPGGNAPARNGGDEIPAINPCSLWDLSFRPSCPDPRGMALVEMPGRRFWCDIYLTGANCHADGTSVFGATIADGDDRPIGAATGKKFKSFDYPTAVAVMASHGKQLLGLDEFFAAAYGVTEKTAHDGNPKVTGLDALRSSKFGLMQATGNMWVWGHDGDPDEPRASGFGGSWIAGSNAGSRYANVDGWPGNSNDNLGARGRSDHLQPV
jgi:hypothetical protein